MVHFSIFHQRIDIDGCNFMFDQPNRYDFSGEWLINRMTQWWVPNRFNDPPVVKGLTRQGYGQRSNTMINHIIILGSQWYFGINPYWFTSLMQMMTSPATGRGGLPPVSPGELQVEVEATWSMPRLELRTMLGRGRCAKRRTESKNVQPMVN